MQIDIVNDLQLLTAKPVIYLVNLSERDYIRKKNKWSVRPPSSSDSPRSAALTPRAPAPALTSRLPKIKAWIDENNPGDLLIPFSVALEERLAQEFNDPAAQQAELEKLGTVGALGKITTGGYSALRLIRYFTCGPQEVRAWTIRDGTKAPQAAGVIQCVPCLLCW